MLPFLKRSGSLAGLTVTSLMAIGYFVYLSQHNKLPIPGKAAQPVPAGIEAVLSDVCSEIADSLPEPQSVLRPTLVLPIVDDREGLFTEKLCAALGQHGWYRPVEKGVLGHAFDMAKEVTGIGQNDSAGTMTLSPADLASLMKSTKAEVLVRGSLDRLMLPKEAPAEMKGRIELWEIASDNPAGAVRLFSGEFERPRPAVLPETDSGRAAHVGYRVYTVIALLCLAWPWLMLPWMRSAIREDSNRATLKTLLGITILPLLALSLFLWYRGFSPVDLTLQVLLSGILLFFYASLVMSKVQSALR